MSRVTVTSLRLDGAHWQAAARGGGLRQSCQDRRGRRDSVSPGGMTMVPGRRPDSEGPGPPGPGPARAGAGDPEPESEAAGLRLTVTKAWRLVTRTRPGPGLLPGH